MAVSREANWKWAITTEDEWYKAAYHKNNGNMGDYYIFPMSSDDPTSNVLTSPDPGNNANFYDGGFTIGGPYYRTEAGAFENSGSPYDTFDQGGNVWEWNEAIVSTSYRGLRGGAFDGNDGNLLVTFRYAYDPTLEYENLGFRLSAIPEPGSMAALALGAVGVLRRRRNV